MLIIQFISSFLKEKTKCLSFSPSVSLTSSFSQWRNKRMWFEAHQGGDKLHRDDHWQCQNNYCTQTWIYFDITLGSQRFSNGAIKVWAIMMAQTQSQAQRYVGLSFLVKQHHLWVLWGLRLGLHVEDVIGLRSRDFVRLNQHLKLVVVFPKPFLKHVCFVSGRIIRSITSTSGCWWFTTLHRKSKKCQRMIHMKGGTQGFPWNRIISIAWLNLSWLTWYVTRSWSTGWRENAIHQRSPPSSIALWSITDVHMLSGQGSLGPSPYSSGPWPPLDTVAGHT